MVEILNLFPRKLPGSGGLISEFFEILKKPWMAVSSGFNDEQKQVLCFSIVPGQKA